MWIKQRERLEPMGLVRNQPDRCRGPLGPNRDLHIGNVFKWKARRHADARSVPRHHTGSPVIDEAAGTYVAIVVADACRRDVVHASGPAKIHPPMRRYDSATLQPLDL